MNMAKHYEIVKVKARGEMVLPAPGKLLGIKEGDQLAVYVDGEEIILRKLTPFKKASSNDAIFKLIGMGEGPSDLAEHHDFYLASDDKEI
ncbi:hypothetical protein MGLY_10690 [Neomoorella glycerini]|uniref:SpoVT-AbrB domain-containing protein n=1 Tax=Neomoorella glycerini TaxID=55779 RepID=A0A6I5ZQ53_9FIRM|nr:AbrB/MazE/SpoVT family DNA-binding domain-containing protein [Moorella glycerini]QGP91727.1 hypothetical protein MGLY_10690 [Moorella glycerini]